MTLPKFVTDMWVSVFTVWPLVLVSRTQYPWVTIRGVVYPGCTAYVSHITMLTYLDRYYIVLRSIFSTCIQTNGCPHAEELTCSGQFLQSPLHGASVTLLFAVQSVLF